MSEWPTIPLGQLAKPKQWPTLSKVEMTESGFPVYGANGRIGYHDTFTHEKPTILIGCRGSCGTVHVTEPKSYANGNAMALDELDEARADLGFLVQFFRKRGFRDVTSGTSQPQIIRQNIVRVEIPLPPLAEQQRIAEVLDRAEALRAKRRAALAQLDSLTQSLFLDLFGDPIFNPKRIPTRPLGEMIRVKSGDSVLVSELSDSGEFPVYGGNGINGYHTRFMFESPIIVIGRVGVYCGVVHITKPNAWVTDNALFVTDITPELDLQYLAQALTIANLNQYAGRAAQPLVSGSRIYPVKILVPPISLQREFARRVTAVEALKTAQRASLAELDALFATLQHRAFRGEL